MIQPGFLRWLLDEPGLTFHGWLDTRSLPFPGETDRVCDTVACLSVPAASPRLWAVPVEFQTRPDRTMFGRLLEYLGRLWRERRPEFGKQRYRIGAALVNLTGQRNTASRRMRLGQSRVRTLLSVAERTLPQEDASSILDGIQAGTWTRCLLPWVPLMRGGGEAAIITRWVALAQAEPDRHLRADYGGLALVFAELTRHRAMWQKALEGWNVVESQQVLEWMKQGEAKGRAEGRAEGRTEGETLGVLKARREDLRLLLEEKFGPLPETLLEQIESIQNPEQLRDAIRQANRIQNLTDLKL